MQQAGEYNTYNQQAGRLANLMEGLEELGRRGHQAGRGRRGALLINFGDPLRPHLHQRDEVRPGAHRARRADLHRPRCGRQEERLRDGAAHVRMLEGAVLWPGCRAAQQSGLIEVSGPLPERRERARGVGASGQDALLGQGRRPLVQPRKHPRRQRERGTVGLMRDAMRRGEEASAVGKDADWAKYGLDAMAQYASGRSASGPCSGRSPTCWGWRWTSSAGTTTAPSYSAASSAQAAPLSGASRGSLATRPTAPSGRPRGGRRTRPRCTPSSGRTSPRRRTPWARRWRRRARATSWPGSPAAGWPGRRNCPGATLAPRAR